MSKKGGYQIIDFCEHPVTTTATAFAGVYEEINKSKKKSCLISGLVLQMLDGTKNYNDFFTIPIATETGYEFTIPGYKITVNATGTVKFSVDQGGGTTYTAGDGLTLVGNQFSVKVGEGLFFDDNDQVCLNNATQQAIEQIDEKSTVTGENDGTNWTSLTVDGETFGIPAGGGSSHLYLHCVNLAIDSFSVWINLISDRSTVYETVSEISENFGGTFVTATSLLRNIPENHYYPTNYVQFINGSNVALVSYSDSFGSLASISIQIDGINNDLITQII